MWSAQQRVRLPTNALKCCRHTFVAVLFLWRVNAERVMRTLTLNCSTPMNNNKAARRLEHAVRLQKPAGQYKLLSEDGKKGDMLHFGRCSTAVFLVPLHEVNPQILQRTRESCSKIRWKLWELLLHPLCKYGSETQQHFYMFWLQFIQTVLYFEHSGQSALGNLFTALPWGCRTVLWNDSFMYTTYLTWDRS